MKQTTAGIIALHILVSAPAAAGAPAKLTAWFLKSGDEKQWCAFTSRTKAKQAGASEAFNGSETAWMDYRSDGILGLVAATESEDAYTEDSYTFDPQGRVKQIVRKGSYAEQSAISATYTPAPNGKLALAPASQAVRKRQEKSGNETYFLDWPLYASLETMPFRALIKRNPAIVVTERCVKAPR